MEKRLILIDGYSLFFRAFFATAYTGQFMHTSEGLPTNALFAFSNMIFRVLNEHNFTHIAVALDPGEKTFRHDILPEYKGTRSETPPEMYPQFELLPELLKALNIKYYRVSKYEADDIIGTLAREAEREGYKVDILSSDRDLLQLVDTNTRVRLLKKGLSEIEDVTPEALYADMEIKPEQIIDLKGLMGDNSDNIPGVPGIGPKTALKLLHQYGTIEKLYDHIDELKGKQREKLVLHETQARLSKVLATIECDINVGVTLDTLQYSGIDLQAAQQFYRKIEAKTLVKKVQNIYDMQQTTMAIDEMQNLDGLLDDILPENIELATADTILTIADTAILYLEHPYENYHLHQQPLYVAIKDVTQIYIFPWNAFIQNETVLAWLADEDKHKAVFDSKKVYAIAHYADITIKGVNFDIALATYVMNPGAKIEELADVAQVLSFSFPFQENIYGKGAKFSTEHTDKIIDYTKSAIEMCELCIHELEETLAEEQLTSLLHDIEMPVAKILSEMEVTGIRVDANVLKAQGEIISQRINKLTQDIWQFAGEEFNIASPKQLGVILFEKLHLPVIKKTKTGYSTAADVLEQLLPEHDIIPLITEYRQLTKLDSTYIKGLIPMISTDGKIHTIYKQALTQTGRLSSIEPNLQNIPIRLEEGRLIRKAFVPENNQYVLVASDYSQIELRVLAELADVAELIDAFKHNRDIHTETATKIFDVPSEQVTPLMRSQAKTVNFGIIYGMSDFGLATQLGITRQEAKNFIERYFELFPGVRDYMNRTIASAEKRGYVETVLKRRRYFPTIHSKNFNERNFARRAAMNAPIQGSAADILKVAMIKIDQKLKMDNYQTKMLLQVHDELIFDVPEDELERVSAMIVAEMTHAYQMDVPLAVSIAEGHNWYETK